jgi:hypothetical protein
MSGSENDNKPPAAIRLVNASKIYDMGGDAVAGTE